MDAKKLDKRYYDTRNILLRGAPEDDSTLAALGIDPRKKRGLIGDTVVQAAVRLAQAAEAILQQSDSLLSAKEENFRPPSSKKEFKAVAANEERNVSALSPHLQRALCVQYFGEVISAAYQYKPGIAEMEGFCKEVAALKPAFTLIAIASFQEAAEKLRKLGEKEAATRLNNVAKTLCEIHEIKPERLDGRIKSTLRTFTPALQSMKRYMTACRALDTREQRWLSTVIAARLKIANRVSGNITSSGKAAPPVPDVQNMITFTVDTCNVGVKWEPAMKRLTFMRPRRAQYYAGYYEGMSDAEIQKTYGALTEQLYPNSSGHSENISRIGIEEAHDALMAQLHNTIITLYPEAAKCISTPSPRFGLALKEPPPKLLSDLHIDPERAYHSAKASSALG